MYTIAVFWSSLKDVSGHTFEYYSMQNSIQVSTEIINWSEQAKTTFSLNSSVVKSAENRYLVTTGILATVQFYVQ